MDILIFIIIGLSFFLAFSIGSQDQTFATTIGSGALSVKKSVIIASVLSFIGTIFLSQSVGKTIGANLLGPSVSYTLDMVVAIIFGTSIWLIFASLIGAPISTTHTIVGAVFGIGVVWSLVNGQPFMESINWNGMGRVALGWVLSPLLGYVGAVVITTIVKRIMSQFNTGFSKLERSEFRFMKAIIIFTCINQVSRAGNDSGNALGIFYSLVQAGEMEDGILPIMTVIIGVCYMVGILLVAKNVLTNVASSTGDLRPSEAVSVEASTGIVLFLSTILGFPVSGTHIAIFALFGNARMRGENPDRRSLAKMLITWTVTFPIGAILSGFVYYLLIVIL